MRCRAAVGGSGIDLVDRHEGRRKDTDFAGKWRLTFFGYTGCPDICPLDLDLMRRDGRFATVFPHGSTRRRPAKGTA